MQCSFYQTISNAAALQYYFTIFCPQDVKVSTVLSNSIQEFFGFFFYQFFVLSMLRFFVPFYQVSGVCLPYYAFATVQLDTSLPLIGTELRFGQYPQANLILTRTFLCICIILRYSLSKAILLQKTSCVWILGQVNHMYYVQLVQNAFYYLL